MKRRLEFKYVPLNKIYISRSNVRKTNAQEDIDELVRNIESIGIQQPIVVISKENRYELIIGQRRYYASKIARLREIPAIITTVKNQTDAMIRSFSENIHRLKLDYRDKMNVATSLLNQLGSVSAVSSALGVSEPTVRNYLGYDGVPEELKKLVSDRKISAATATEISKNIPDKKEAVAIAKKVIEAPRGDRRRAIIETAKENPDKGAAEIDRLSKKQHFRKIILHLTPRVANALSAACRDFSSEPADIARDVLEEWLISQGFLK